jgi:hypothetical protein
MQRVLCIAQFSLTLWPKRGKFSHYGHLRSRDDDAPSSGCARLEPALPHDALPHLCRANDLSRAARCFSGIGRYHLCLSALRGGAGSHLDPQHDKARRRSGLSANPLYHFANPSCLSTARPSSPYGLPSVSNISKWLQASPIRSSTGLPAAFTAAAKSRVCRWNSGVS